MYTFGGVAATPLLIIGQLINLSGGGLYTFEKYRLIFNFICFGPQSVFSYLHRDSSSVVFFSRIQRARQLAQSKEGEKKQLTSA